MREGLNETFSPLHSQRPPFVPLLIDLLSLSRPHNHGSTHGSKVGHHLAAAPDPTRAASQERAQLPPSYSLSGTGCSKSDARSLCRMFRRKKASEASRVSSEPLVVTREVLSAFFDRSLRQASFDLGISPTALKSMCRKLEVRFPHANLQKFRTTLLA